LVSRQRICNIKLLPSHAHSCSCHGPCVQL